MRILQIHNRYQQPGGEDTVRQAERDLLRDHGHEVIEYLDDNHRIASLHPFRLASQTIWSRQTYHRLSTVLADAKPDLAHFHNTFPLISPSAYWACHAHGVPVVQTLHNYRLLCPAATLYRQGKICEHCVGRTLPWPAILRRCYRGSAAQTAVASAMLTTHRILGTWSGRIDAFIALTEFARSKYIEGGLPSKNIFVKSNFVHPAPYPSFEPGEYALFVGRLSPEKGIRTLLEALTQARHVPTRIVGAGPLLSEVQRFVTEKRLEKVQVVGPLKREEVFAAMRGARFLVFPSECYETQGMTILEALACGLPIVALRLAAMSEMLVEGKIGFTYGSDASEDLTGALEQAWIHAPMMRIAARRTFEARFSERVNYERLIQIYAAAAANHGPRSESRVATSHANSEHFAQK